MVVFIQFIYSFVLIIFRRLLPFLRNKFPSVFSYTGTLTYLFMSISLAVSFIVAANAVIDTVSSSAVMNRYLIVAFSYLPHNFTFCANLVLAADFISFLFHSKDRIYRYIRLFISGKISGV
ncbi:TPA: hypothetical protein JWK76_005319 [Escherichia coli]|uniref:hypothetical protein n=1 Tax=Escherichia coli TaxID=562 RepID=UPI00022439F0|nr:hypothetical protein [Escherichia coli]EES3798126.1 hypothetical protein [Escherichia coli]EFC9846898.1 hypothetical protein [Escherichia coli]EFG2179290.1 hypothetical protein [Escherichia coli]EFJ5716360.1 hypothetical protein [Escherichia coli]EFK3238343.1 hypothetical protein [Escherichia coli]